MSTPVTFVASRSAIGLSCVIFAALTVAGFLDHGPLASPLGAAANWSQSWFQFLTKAVFT